MDHIAKASKILKDGGIVIFPTDTAFGIGCRMDDEQAVSRLYTLRRRSEQKASSILISDLHMAEPYLKPVPQKVIKDLVERYWPGALTIVLPCDKESVSPLIRGGSETLGVRVPNHLTTLEFINRVGVPILGPSANFPGQKTPYAFADLDPELVQLVDYVVPGECNMKEVSTVIDATSEPWKILRLGAVKL
ncbi:MAG: L-threonylcarbamoyladenylate synthase [Candidatus Levyibacteriota bacterium]